MSLKGFLHKHQADIYAAAGGLSTIGAVGLAAYGGRKIGHWEKENPNAEKKEVVLEYVKQLGAAGVTAAFSVAMIFCGRKFTNSQTASLVAAYEVAKKGYNNYKEHVKEVLGPVAEEKVEREIHKEATKDIPVPTGDKRLFYDRITDTYFESTFEEVKDAEYFLNRTLSLNGYVTWADYLSFLNRNIDISKWDAIGFDVDWMIEDCESTWVDFYYHETELEDGLVVITVDPIWEPQPFECEGL